MGLDFTAAKVLPVEQVYINAGIAVANEADVNQLAANIFAALQAEVAPLLSPSQVNAMSDQALAAFDKPGALHGSRLISAIMGVAGVQGVSQFQMHSNVSGASSQWQLVLEATHSPLLAPATALFNSGGQTQQSGSFPDCAG